jgi:putative ABC transport system ATP-binding protein
MIQLENVEKYYGVHKVLKGIHLQIRSGEFVSIMGTSGSGKSTLLNLIGGMDKPENGRVVIDGDNIAAYTDEKLTLYRRLRVGFIFQFFNLLPNITVSENISMPLLLRGGKDEAKVRTYIQRLGLDGKANAYPYELSGGEQQRVAIARALIHDPDIILADEPTGSLDSETGMMIMESIRQITNGTGKTVVLVTHESHIAEYAQRTMKMKDGMIYP